MTKEAERRLISTVEKMIELTNSGEDPTAALVKVSQDLDNELVRRVGEAYNQSRTLHELNEKVGEDRLNTFPLANIDEALKKLRPEKYASVSQKNLIKEAQHTLQSPMFNVFDAKKALRSAPMEKAAEAKTPEPKTFQHLEKRAERDAMNDLRQSVSSFGTVLTKCADDIRTATYFQPFHKLEMLAFQKWGEVGIKLMDLLYAAGRLEKVGQRRALPHELDSSSYTVIDFRNGEFASVERLFGAAMDMHKKAGVSPLKGKPKTVKVPNLDKKIPLPSDPQPGVKQSFLSEVTSPLTSTYSTLNGMSGRSIKERGEKAYQTALEADTLKMDDPKFQNGLQQIRSQAALHDLMSNDEVIGSYTPEEVVDAFNTIQSIAPEAGTNKGVLRDLLRRHLVQGGLESMDLGQAAQLNKTIIETKGGLGKLRIGVHKTPQNKPPGKAAINP